MSISPVVSSPNYTAGVNVSFHGLKSSAKAAEKLSKIAAEKISQNAAIIATVSAPLAMAALGIANSSKSKEASVCEIPPEMPTKSAAIKDTTVTVAGGDMTSIKADAYVVPQFDSCISEGGVGSAIIRRGAVDGMEAYGKYISKNGILNMGDIVITESGGGNSNYLIHAVTVGASETEAFDVVRDTVYKALVQAQQEGIKSIVIPALGTGIIGSLTNVQSANAILSAVNKFAEEGGKMDVSIVVYSRGQGFNDFAKVLSSEEYKNAETSVGEKQFDSVAFVSEMTEMINNPPFEQKKRELDSSFKEELLKTTASIFGQKHKENAIKIVTRIMEDCPEIINILLNAKCSDGKTNLFNNEDISSIIVNCESTIKNRPEKIKEILNNKKEVRYIEYFSCHGAGLWKALYY